MDPKKNLSEIERMPFFLALEQEVIRLRAESAGKYIFIALDENSKLGPELIPSDPQAKTKWQDHSRHNGQAWPNCNKRQGE